VPAKLTDGSDSESPAALFLSLERVRLGQTRCRDAWIDQTPGLGLGKAQTGGGQERWYRGQNATDGGGRVSVSPGRTAAFANSPAAEESCQPTILANGLGLCNRRRWQLRSVTFSAGFGAGALGIAGDRGAGKTALLTLLAGLAVPARGELRVLGEDMRTYRGRTKIRRRVGLVPPPGRPFGFTVRGLVTHAAWLSQLPASHRRARIAGALDRLNLSGWAGSLISAMPEDVARRAWLAACTVHEPDLLLVDGLLDGITDEDALALAGCMRTLAVATAVLVAGRDAARLALCCGPVLRLTDGIAGNG
jgi:ABC-2 type transport system ATP-binding protein